MDDDPDHLREIDHDSVVAAAVSAKLSQPRRTEKSSFVLPVEGNRPYYVPDAGATSSRLKTT